MRLIIKVADGACVGHPMAEDNFMQVFPDVDVNNLPAGFAHFNRILPEHRDGFLAEFMGYTLVNGAYQDAWVYVPDPANTNASAFDLTASGSAPNVVG